MSPLLAMPDGSQLSLHLYQGQLRQRLQHVSATGLVAFGFLAELAWAFFGSLGLGLGAWPAVASDTTARLWLVGAVTLAVVFGLAGWIAVPASKRLD